MRQLKGHGQAVLSVAFGPDGKVLASASNDHTLGVWDVRSESIPGLSSVDMYFEPGVTTLRARQLVEERLEVVVGEHARKCVPFQLRARVEHALRGGRRSARRRGATQLHGHAELVVGEAPCVLPLR